MIVSDDQRAVRQVFAGTFKEFGAIRIRQSGEVESTGCTEGEHDFLVVDIGLREILNFIRGITLFHSDHIGIKIRRIPLPG